MSGAVDDSQDPGFEVLQKSLGDFEAAALLGHVVEDFFELAGRHR